ncbi:hypothetical protein [Myceligenerans halotolerans]
MSVRTVSGSAARRALARWVVGVMILAIVMTLLVGWVSQARAATTDRLEVLNARIDERVAAGRATSERLTTVIVVARNVRADSAGADPEARATLDAAIHAAEGIVGQHVTTQEPATVPQAEMLVEQAVIMEEALALAMTDLRTAVDRVRVSQGDLRAEGSGDESADAEGADIVMAVARP